MDDTALRRLLAALHDGRRTFAELEGATGESAADIRATLDQLVAGGAPLAVDDGGVELASAIDLLERDRVLAHLDPVTTARLDDIEVVLQTGSTNADVLDRAQAEPGRYARFAEQQLAGRGRRGRNWFSPFACNLYMSLSWPLAGGPQAASGLSLALGTAVLNACADLGGRELGLKWPNDVYGAGRKLAGILVESAMHGMGTDGGTLLAIGCGINVAMPAMLTDRIDQPFTQLSDIAPPVDRNRLAAALLSRTVETLVKFETEGFAAFVDTFAGHDLFADREVRLLGVDQEIAGIARGVDELGHLRLERDGRIETHVGGELSLRPAPGGDGP